MTWSQQGFAKEGYLFFDVVDQALLDYDGREDTLWKLQVFTTSTSTSLTTRTRTTSTMTTTTRTTTTRTWTESKWKLTARTFVWSTAGTLSVFALGMSLVLLGVIAGVVNFSRLLCNEDEDLLEKQAPHQNGAGEGEHDTADRIGRAQPKPAVFGSGLSTPHADRPISSELLVCVDQAEDVSARPDASTRRPLLQVVLTSPKLLALKMILESTNLVSSMMYTVEAYQRATRMTFTVQCVDNNILMPADPTECLEVANFNTLPWCSADVLLGSLCEGDEAEADMCPLNRELDNCEDASGFAHDLYRRTGPQKCGLVDCNFLAGVLWVLSTSSIAFTVLWTISWHFRGMLRDFSAKLSWGLSCCSVLCIWIALLFVGFFGDDGTSVVTFACLLPIVVIIAWIAAAGLATFCKGPRRRSAALELPLFNVLVALWLQPEDVEDMQAERRGLDLGLRVVEDLPEILMGVADLAFFKFSWFALSSIIMSMAMFFFYVLAASFRLLNKAAEAVAKDTE
ncbi:Tspear [Symbiodinium sp. CCMP2456]|nr:Tspear [Symbiodinium sp. CCMP2456]